ELSLFDRLGEGRIDPLHPLLGELFAHLSDHRPVTGLRGHLRDPGAHQPGPEHADLANLHSFFSSPSFPVRTSSRGSSGKVSVSARSPQKDRSVRSRVNSGPARATSGE